MTCLTELQLEAVLLGATTGEAQRHVDGCARCSAALVQMRAEGAHFKQYVFPATVDAVIGGARPRRRWAWALVPVAVAAAALLVVRTRPPDDYVGVKGQTVGLAVFSVDASGAPVRLDDGVRVTPEASLRFQVRPDAPCHLWLLSVDQRGEVSRLFPPEGEAVRVVGETTLPGGAQLDGTVGPERLFAVCTESPLQWPELAHVAALGPEAVRRTTTLPVAGRQATLLLEKSP